MKNVSLIKLTSIGIMATLTSSFVNAGGDIKKSVEQSQPELVPQIEFSALIAKLDTDNNGSLSKKELRLTQNKVLREGFKKMDINKDSQIDDAEYDVYLVEMNDNLSEVVKSLSSQLDLKKQ